MPRLPTLFIAVLALSAASAALWSAPEELMVLGNQIVTKAGHCPVRLKGVDSPGLEWSNTGDGPVAANRNLAVAQYAVANWACNFIRLPLNQDRWMGTACGASAASYQALVQQIVDWCSANNVYVLLDLHWSDLGTAGGGTVCSAGQHDMPDDNSLLFWQSVAGTSGIANNPAVFFDLYNEPGGAKASSALSNDGAGWALWRDGGTVPASADGTAYHTPGMQGLLNAIRATGAGNLVFAGGRDWAFDLTGIVDYGAALSDSSPGNGVVYTTHIYPFKWGGNSCVSSACFDTAVPYYVRDSYPVVVTEFGPNAGDPEGFLQPLIDWINLHNLSFSAWCMHTGASPCLISDWSFTPTSYFGAPFMATLLGTNPLGCNPATATPSPSPSPTATPLPACGETVVFRVNCGGGAYVDGAGDTWEADAHFTGGSTSSTTTNVTGTSDPSLFKKNRWGNPLSYSFGVPNGNYRVEILQSENYWTAAGKRVFDLSLNGSVVRAGYDIYASTGGQFKAEVLTYNTSVGGGILTVSAAASVDNAQFAGIRVTFLGPGCTATPTISPTFSISPTFTVSPTITPTHTHTPVVSPTPSSTVTPSWTASPTATITPTYTDSPTVTVTLTPAPKDGPLGIRRVVGVPNPNARSLVVELSGPADRVEAAVYSAAYARVLEVGLEHAPQGYCRLYLPAAWWGLPKGVYFVRVQAWRGEDRADPRTAKLVKLF